MSLAVDIEAANEVVFAADSHATIALVGMAETGAALIQKISPVIAAQLGGDKWTIGNLLKGSLLESSLFR